MNTSASESCARTNWPVLALAAALGAFCLWIYWPSFREMAAKWSSDPQYSHGYLVPIFALVLLYMRRDRLAGVNWRFDWRGLLLLAIGGLGLFAGGYMYFDWLTAVSLLPTLAGLVTLFGGWPALRWAWPAIAFLVFMIPLPYAVESALSQPLQRVAAGASTRVLQTIGYPAYSEGNVIVLEQGRIAVVEACNGLSMLLTFAAITTGMAMIINRPLLDRIIVILSTIPIALAVNIARISSNGIAMEIWDAETANQWFHDQAGWLMMPLAIGVVWFELWLLSRLFVEVPEEKVTPLAGLPLNRATKPSQAAIAHK
jgi:exosortase